MERTFLKTFPEHSLPARIWKGWGEAQAYLKSCDPELLKQNVTASGTKLMKWSQTVTEATIFHSALLRFKC